MRDVVGVDSRAKRARGSDGRKHLEVTVQIATNRRGIPHARTLASWARAAYADASSAAKFQRSAALTIRIVGAAESRRLNRTWRGKDKPTNVLSFPGVDATDSTLPTAYSLQPTVILGDLAVCAPVVRREACEQRKPLRAHWAHMIVHGVLHLLGYDHEDEHDAQRMEALEVQILARMGIDNPYVAALAA